MPLVFIYLLKLSISLAIVFLFYQVVLRRLTFYNWNRWYLLGYSLLSFVIALIDISPVLEQQAWTNSEVVQFVPVIGINVTDAETLLTAEDSFHLNTWNLISLLIVAGMLLLFLRLIIQLLSIRRIMKKAKLVHADGMKLYQVERDIIPFSFGNSIFINRHLHTEEELREIISHEFVHVKQRHSLDIIWGEILCLLNWYNPFAWLLRRSIRQNLEFIADGKVLEYGVDPKQYQYLLLKVIGNNQFSIAPKFNFSSLKKRIAMMNKMKSAGVHIVKFLFILPLVAVLLLAFRNQRQAQDTTVKPNQVAPLGHRVDAQIRDLRTAVFTDTVQPVKTINSKGYLINVKGVNGTCVVVVTDKIGKEVERVLLTEWDENIEKFENKYGEILPPPPAVEPSIVVAPALHIEPTIAFALSEPIAEITPALAIHTVVAVSPTVAVKGIAIPCQSSLSDTIPLPSMARKGTNLRNISTEWEINDKKAVIKLKDGVTEEYDLTNPAQKKKFEDKYGRIIHIGNNGSALNSPVAIIGGPGGTTAIAGYTPVPDNDVLVVDLAGHTINGSEDIIVTITKNTTREQLEDFKKQMKAKGIELDYDEIEYDGAKLVKITGTMKSGGSTSNFVATDFEKLVLAMIKKGDKTYFKVSSSDEKRVI